MHWRVGLEMTVINEQKRWDHQNEEQEHSPYGRTLLWINLSQYFCKRWKIHDQLKKNPECTHQSAILALTITIRLT
jgi:hypothetical protein